MISAEPCRASVDEDELRRAVSHANIPALLMVLIQLTGDLKWMKDPYRPIRAKGLDDNDTGGLSKALQEDVRQAAIGAILNWSKGSEPALEHPSDSMLVEMLSVAMGEPIPSEYGPMIAANMLASLGSEPTVKPIVSPPSFNAIVIGAGLSGICAATKLREAGISVTILEKSADFGGTWLQHQYPGVSVDTPSYLYSYSFLQFDWSSYFASGAEIRQYLVQAAKAGGVTENAIFNTEVTTARYDESDQVWIVEARTSDGASVVYRSKLLISAVGAFNRPRTPSSPDFSAFGGSIFHSMHWPSDLTVNGKRVAVVGNGATAMQLVPAIADAAKSITIFQRSSHWIAPFEKFQVRVPEAARYLLRAMPLYYAWYRARLSWLYHDSLHEALQKDPNWTQPQWSINAVNDRYRQFLTEYIKSELGDRQDLLPQVLPSYPPMGKRLLLDNGWYKALSRRNVNLVSGEIAAVERDCLITSDGSKYVADIIVLATGYDVVRFLSTIRVIGKSGIDLRSAWDEDDARAYLGTTVPGFPNLFMLYGPNTQQGHGGSLISAIECQVDYIAKLARKMVEEDIAVIDVKRDVFECYNDQVHEAHQEMIWTHPGVDTYYRNAKGRVVVNSPFRLVDFWSMTKKSDLGDYQTYPSR
jgi:4-hydroxyacetophenone monooxygenase